MTAALHLLGQWVRRDFRIRFTQTALGSAWAVAQPLALTGGFVFLFRGIADVETGAPYASFVYCGMLMWSLFANGATQATQAMLGSIGIASKAKYPRIVAPISGGMLALADLAIGLAVLPVFFATQHAEIHLRPHLALAALIGVFALVIGLGTLLSALTVFVRDVRLILPFALQIGVLLTPVAYKASDVSSRVPEGLRSLLTLNPMAVYVTGFRAAFLDVPAPTGGEWLRALAISAGMVVIGIAYFRAVEDRFADVA